MYFEMYFTMPCPNCQRNLRASQELIGKTARCPYCRSVVTVQPPLPPPPPGEGVDSIVVAAPAGAPAEERAKPTISPGGTQVNLLLTGLFALVATILFYLVLVLPLRRTYFGALFAHRGWVQYAITFLAAWSVLILYRKYRKIRAQRDAMLFDVLPLEISRDITPENVIRFRGHLLELPCRPQDSFLINRVFRALEHFRSRKSVQEVAGLLSSQAEIDASTVESSYTMLKVFVWAVPILGFIGTVIGIGAAVGGFSDSLRTAQDLAVVKDSLGTVTSGLAVAFDTTLLALVMSLGIMFPTSSMQKAEEDLLNSIDDYCNENLLMRLDDGGREARSEPEAIRRAVGKALAEHEAELRQWSERLDSIAGTLTRHVTEGWQAVHRQLQETHRSQAQEIRGLITEISEGEKAFLAQIKSLENAQVNQLTNLLTTMSGDAARIQRQIASSQEDQAKRFQELIEALAGDMQTLQEQMGETQSRTAESLREAAAAFAGTVSDVQSTLDRLNAALGAVGRQAGLLEATPVSDDSRPDGWTRRLWRTLRGRR